MRRIRSFMPTPMQLLAIASVLIVGIAIGAQNQEEPRSAPPKTPAKAVPKAARDAAPDEAVPAPDRSQPKTSRDDRPTSEDQRAAGLGAQFEVRGDQGLLATTIEQNSIWARAGLRQNDRIISIEGYAFNNPRQLDAFLWSQPGRQIPVIIDRGGQRYTIQVNIPQHRENSGWLGLNLVEGDADAQGEADVKGARITQVYPSGPASRAGLQQGDIITQINQQPVEGSADAVMLIRELQPRATVELVVLRDKEELEIPVVVGNRGSFMYQSFYSGQPQSPYNQSGQRPGQPGNDQRFTGNDQFQNVPPHAMQLEHDRRNAEQHERIEDEIRMLREEVRKLREMLEKK